MKILWVNFIHLYQPANSPAERIAEAVEKSYLRLTRLLEEHPNLHFTANISGCLLERLKEGGYDQLLDRWKKLISEGRLEIVGSAAYHGFLPLLPEGEVRYQIRRQEEIVQEILGADIKGGGFFLPEMAYSPALGKIVSSLGYRWLILDEACLPEAMSKEVYKDKASGLVAVIRQRKYSNSYAPDLVAKLIKEGGTPGLMVTATDAELYGLRHEDPTAELEKMAALPQLETKTISYFLEGKEAEEIKLQSGTWETDRRADHDKPYAIWNGNNLQKDLWRLAEFAIKAGERHSGDDNYPAYRWHLDRGLASCMFWWASGRDFFQSMGPVAWSPDEVEAGLNDLIRSVRSLKNEESRKEKLVVERMAARIRAKLWREHWQKYF